MVIPCFSPALKKSPTHRVPAPQTAPELNMRARGERWRKWEGKRRGELRGDGAKSLCLNSRKVTCEHSAGERDP